MATPRNTGRIGCIRCHSFDGTARKRADLGYETAICDSCALGLRQAWRLSQGLGENVQAPVRTSHLVADGRVWDMHETIHGDPEVVDDGAHNGFWAGPGPMPEYLRALGVYDQTQADDDDEETA